MKRLSRSILGRHDPPEPIAVTLLGFLAALPVAPGVDLVGRSARAVAWSRIPQRLLKVPVGWFGPQGDDRPAGQGGER